MSRGYVGIGEAAGTADCWREGRTEYEFFGGS